MTKRVRLSLIGTLIVLVAATLISTLLTWPQQQKLPTRENSSFVTELVKGTVTAAAETACANEPTVAETCTTATVRVTEGIDKGKDTTLVITNGGLDKPRLEAGNKIVLERASDLSGTSASYSFSDYQRQTPLGWLAVLFAVIVVAIGRYRGFGALIGLGATGIVVGTYLLPSILEGNSPIVVAVTAGSLICFAALYVAHGLNMRTTTALIGTLLGLSITGVLAYFSVKLTSLTGQSSEEIIYVQQLAGHINVQGLLLGGIIIGSLGVLNDVTVTQASSVWEIHRAQPTQSVYRIYRSGMRVGRDHIASTVYTLAIAYVGAALPLLVLFTVSHRGWLEAATSAIVAEEIVRTLVGGIGLVLTVPITTWLAAVIVKRQGSGAMPDGAPDGGNAEEPSSDRAQRDADRSNTRASMASVLAPTTPTIATTPDDADQARLADAFAFVEPETVTIHDADGEAVNTVAQPAHPEDAESDAAESAPNQSQDATSEVGETWDGPGEHTGTIKLDAFVNPKPAKRGLLTRLRLRRSPDGYVHRMSRKERKFWGEYGDATPVAPTEPDATAEPVASDDDPVEEPPERTPE